jgi:dinuclear metal center YbgI/SA1388 family protein
MRLADLVAYLDEYLRTAEVADYDVALNGLQVENSGEVRHLAVAVDAAQAVIDQAAERGADVLVVHHGLFWSGLQPVTGRLYRRLAALVRHDIAVYASHLPLDRHPQVGNNPVLARLLGMEVRGWWGEFRGAPLGVWGELDIERDALALRIGEVLGAEPYLIPGGPAVARRVGIVTGAGGSMIREAHEAGLDTLITGEGAHHTYFDAEELGVNVYYGGHYLTETVGVKALAEHVAERFQLPWSFIDHPTGL